MVLCYFLTHYKSCQCSSSTSCRQFLFQNICILTVGVRFSSVDRHFFIILSTALKSFTEMFYLSSLSDMMYHFIFFSIVMTTFSAVFALFAMPMNLWIHSKIWIDQTDDSALHIPYGTIIQSLFAVTVPAAIGMVIRHYNVKLADRVTKVSIIAEIFAVN